MKQLFDKFGGKNKGGGNRGGGNNPMFKGVDPQNKSSKGKSPMILVVGLTVIVVMLGAMLYFGGANFLTSDTSTKADYIHAYEAFINNTSKNYLTYSVEAWEEADDDFYKFSQKLYNEYYTEMSLAEKMKVGKLPIMYNLFKYKSTIEREVAGTVVENTRALRSHLQDIISETAEIYDGSYDQRIRNILDEFKANGEYLSPAATESNQPAGLGGDSQEGF